MKGTEGKDKEKCLSEFIGSILMLCATKPAERTELKALNISKLAFIKFVKNGCKLHKDTVVTLLTLCNMPQVACSTDGAGKPDLSMPQCLDTRGISLFLAFYRHRVDTVQ